MSTITRELAKLFRKITNSEIDAEGNAHVVLSPADSLLINNARIALASLETEASGRNPVLAYADSYRDMANQGVESIPVWSVITDLERNIAPLFTAPPAPISVPAAMEMDDDFDSAFEHGKAVGWNACRASMLQGAEPVSNSDELPLDYLQGHKDGLEWAAQLAEANHPQTGDWLYDDPIDLARAIRKGPDMPTVQGGNSPEIPDGWVACSERMPEGMTDVHISNGHDVGQGWWDGDTWQTQHDYYSVPGDVTDWQPIPKPPLK